MCAIAGIINLGISEDTVHKMLRTMQRRGPDGSGSYTQPGCTLLHSRLAIIDPVGGSQPMKLRWGQESYILVYNGELYNTEEIRRELLTLGHVFSGHSDTEVVLHAYAQWAESCLERFNGIYAFAVWEEKGKRLFLARDRIGVKPLFFTQTPAGLLFASEIKTILCHPEIKPEIDRDGVYQILLLGPGRVPGSGVFHGIRELEPGCFGFYEAGKLKIHRYWKLRDRPHTQTFEETTEQVHFLVSDAIRRQMVSDVPIGTFLSGGLDSSIISAICAKEKSERGEVLPTFSVDYLNNDRYFQPGKFQPNSDPHYIRCMVDFLNTEHFWTVLTPEELVDALEAATIARDLPGMADVDFSLLAFSKEIRKHVKVALSGECADEIFGGYPWYRDKAIREKAGFPWSQTTRQRVNLINPSLCLGWDPTEYVMDHYRDTCKASDILPESSAQERRMKEMVNLNFRWFMQTLLDRKDRMSMYHSLEVRVPFCDHRIAEYLYSIPWEYKDYQGREKGLLRNAVNGLLPEEIRERKKSPYPKTFDPRYEALVTARLDRLIQDNNSPLFYLVDKKELQAFLKEDAQWPWYGQLMRRPQTIAYFLQIDFWLRHYNISFRF